MRTKDGYWALPIGASHGIDNVVVVTDMKFGSPKIERVYRIDSGNENYNEKVRDEIYEIEGTYDGKSIKYAKEVCESESFVAYSREDYIDLFEDRRYVAGERRRGREVDRAAERLQDGSGSKEAAGENGAVKQSPRRKNQLTNREILVNAFGYVSQDNAEYEFLGKYRKQINSLNEKEAQRKRVQEAIREKIDAARLKTVHSRYDAVSMLEEAIDNELKGNVGLYYWNKKEALSYIEPGQAQRLGRSLKDGFIHSINEEGAHVKSKIGDQTATSQFRRWFKGSKVVNADGSPKVMYHGSPAQFTVFDRKKAKSSGLYGKGFYFTEANEQAGVYGQKYAVYLKVENPLSPGMSKVSKNQIIRFLEAVAENEDDYSIENFGTYDINEIASGITSRDAYGVIQDINATAIGDFAEAIRLFNEVNGTKFDGIIVPTETVVFEPTQIKSATDNIGTFDPENPDIRYSPRRKNQLTNREILASAFEGVAQTAGEREFLEKYKAQIDSLNEKEETLKRVQDAIIYKINSDQVRDEKYRTDLNRLRSEAKRWTRICTISGQSIYNGSRRSKLIICSLQQKSRVDRDTAPDSRNNSFDVPINPELGIADLLKNVNGLFDDVLSKDVADHPGISGGISVFTPRHRFSCRKGKASNCDEAEPCSFGVHHKRATEQGEIFHILKKMLLARDDRHWQGALQHGSLRRNT